MDVSQYYSKARGGRDLDFDGDSEAKLARADANPEIDRWLEVRAPMRLTRTIPHAR